MAFLRPTMNPPMSHPLLQALESVRGWSACAYVWRHHLGDTFAKSKTWLFEDTGEREEHTIPCYGTCRRPHHIVIHNLAKNDIIAPSPSPADYCEAIRLTAADIAIWKIDQPALISEISSVLGIKLSFGVTNATPLLFRLGEKIIDGHRKLAFLATGYDANEYKAQFARLAKHPGSVIYIPTNRPSVREYAEGAGFIYGSLSDELDFSEDLKPRLPIGKLHAPEAAVPHPLPIKGPPLKLRGRRYELAKDFSAVIRKSPRLVHHITAQSAMLALRILVECGAGSSDKCLTKKEWCEAVWQRLKPREEWPRTYRPIDLFKIELEDGRAGTAPYFKEIIRRNPGGGLYWLEL